MAFQHGPTQRWSHTALVPHSVGGSAQHHNLLERRRHQGQTPRVRDDVLLDGKDSVSQKPGVLYLPTLIASVAISPTCHGAAGTQAPSSKNNEATVTELDWGEEVWNSLAHEIDILTPWFY